MDFGLNQEQIQLGESVRQVVESRYSMSYVRAMQNDPRGFSTQFWSDAARLGWLGLLVDATYGGSGLGPLDLVAVQQELGRGVVPGPYFSSAVLATAALQRLGTAEQKERWLTRLAKGEAIATIALQEPCGGWDAEGVALAAVAAKPGFLLSGEKRFVTDADVADLVIVPARTDAAGAEGVTLFLVETRHPGVTAAAMKTIDATRHLCELHLAAVELGEDAVLGEIGKGWPPLEAVADLGRLALCAEMVGGAERALAMSTDYARTRVQFGRPIGSFQAIQHKCADMLVQLEGARSMTFAAATSLAHGDDDASIDIAIAKAFCGETYRAVTTEGVQIHGGLGFTWELDMHLYFKRARGDELLLGDGRFQRSRVGQRTLGAL